MDKQTKFILVEWIDKDNIYHSGVYLINDKKEVEKKLNMWCSQNLIKSYDIKPTDNLIISS